VVPRRRAVVRAAGRSSPALPARLAGYQILYRADTSTGGGDVVRWEALVVDRPFESADLMYDSRPSGDASPTGGYIATDRALYDVDGSGVHLVSARQPGVPPGDQDLATQLPDMLARHLAADTGTVRSIDGLQCRVYRLFEPPSGPIKPLADPGDHDDLCVASDGIVLSEAWTYHGQLAYSRVAVSVALSPSPIPPVPGGGSPSGPSLVADAVPHSFVATPPTPPGFEPAGTYDFTLPDPQHQGALEAASVVWVFTRGADVVTVEAGVEAGGALPWDPSDTPVHAVTLAGLGPAQTAIRSDGAEVRIDLGAGHWVRVHGTESSAWLARYAGGVQRSH
jgi:hypothetical protein